MTMSNEKMEMLSKYLAADADRLAALQALPVTEAVARINADGYSFTEGELVAFEEEMYKIAEQHSGELNEESLDCVTGGTVRLAVWIGYWIGRERAWRKKHWG